MQEIGDYYGVTRERVRQVLVEELGVSGSDGGAAVRARAKKEASLARRDQRFLVRYGMTHDEYRRINNAHSPRPIRAFTEQKRNARVRGVEWDLTFAEWWCIWHESGKWSQRGRGRDKYVMARHGDSGAYRAGNVKIIRFDANNSEYIRRYWKEVRAGERPPPKAPKRRSVYSGMYSGMKVGETRTRALSGVAVPRYAQSGALNHAKANGWKVKTRIADGVLTVTRIS